MCKSDVWIYESFVVYRDTRGESSTRGTVRADKLYYGGL